MSLLDTALALLSKGKSIIPICYPDGGGCLQHGPSCHHPGKVPLVRWQEFTTRLPTESEVRAWFGTATPKNIALITGMVSKTVVVDCDGEDGYRAVQAKGFEPTLSALTGREGGRHLFFLDGTVRIQTAVKLLPNVDVRGEGGYVVIPPSLHASGRSYRYDPATTGFGVKRVPAWLMPTERPQQFRERLDVARVMGGVGEGERDESLFRLACMMRDRGFPRVAAERAVLDAAAACIPPFDSDEALAKVERAWSKYQPSPERSYMLPAQPPASALAFQSPSEVAEATTEHVPWILPGMIAKGEVTLLGGREKSGKSTLLFALMRQMLDGGFFLERSVLDCPVLYLTEEGPSTVAEKCKRFGVDGGVFFCTRTACPAVPPLDDLVAQVERQAEQVGAGLVVIDTLAHWCGLAEGQENDASVMAGVVAKFHRLTAKGLAVVLVHHLAKGGLEFRGSTAIPGGVDTLMTFIYSKGGGTRRMLMVKGRHDACPPRLDLELGKNGYALIQPSLSERYADETD